MKVIQEATKELFVQKLLCMASRTHVLQTVVIQTVKQIYSKGERPDPTSVTRDVTSYIRDLLMQRDIADGEMEQILQPIPFFVTSTINRLASDYPNLPDETVDDKSKNRKSSRQSKRQSTQKSSNMIITPATSPVSPSPSPVQAQIATSITSKQPTPSVSLEPKLSTPTPSSASSASLAKPPVEVVDSPRITPTPTSSPRIALTPTASPRIAPTPTTSPRYNTSTNSLDSTSIDDVVMKLGGGGGESGQEKQGRSDKKHRSSTRRHKRKKTKSGEASKTIPPKGENAEATPQSKGEEGRIVNSDDIREGVIPKSKHSTRKEKRPSSERREHRKRREKKEKTGEKTNCKFEEESTSQGGGEGNPERKEQPDRHPLVE